MGNIPTFITVSEFEQEFKNFGKLKPEGVTIRSHKVSLMIKFLCLSFCILKQVHAMTMLTLNSCGVQDTGVSHSFVEFEHASGVHNALEVCLDLICPCTGLNNTRYLFFS